MHICKSCQRLFLRPKLSKRTLSCGIDVFSFYEYEEIKELLHTKHSDLGYHIYTILAHNSFKRFAEEFSYTHELCAIGIDDRPKYGYSHTAILTHALKSEYIHPLYAKLHAGNDITYSGKSKRFREQNPREFRLGRFTNSEVILVDDIVTTGTTLCEAHALLQKAGKQTAFCLTLAHAKRT